MDPVASLSTEGEHRSMAEEAVASRPEWPRFPRNERELWMEE